MLSLAFSPSFGLDLGDARLGWSRGWSGSTGDRGAGALGRWRDVEAGNAAVTSGGVLGDGLRGVVEGGGEHARSLDHQTLEGGGSVGSLSCVNELHKPIGAAAEDTSTDCWLLAHGDDVDRGAIAEHNAGGLAASLELREEDLHIVLFHVLVYCVLGVVVRYTYR